MRRTVHFTKMQGAGNDYIYVDTQLYDIPDPEKAAIAWSAYHTGIGSDGLVLIGKPHDGRAPDYDDWSTVAEDGSIGLNGDILIWYPVLGRSFELSSMGIRVDKDALVRQLQIEGKEERLQLYFHKKLMADELPLSIGGGIGQSRLCMVLLHKAHIGEIQASIWPEEMRNQCRELGMPLI